MRTDGTADYFLVEALLEVTPGRPRWSEVDLASTLFEKLTYEERNSSLAVHFRNMLQPQSASSDLWQEFGIHGFVNAADALLVLFTCRNRRPDRTFRLVRRVICRSTEVVDV